MIRNVIIDEISSDPLLFNAHVRFKMVPFKQLSLIKNEEDVHNTLN